MWRRALRPTVGNDLKFVGDEPRRYEKKKNVASGFTPDEKKKDVGDKLRRYEKQKETSGINPDAT